MWTRTQAARAAPRPAKWARQAECTEATHQHQLKLGTRQLQPMRVPVSADIINRSYDHRRRLSTRHAADTRNKNIEAGEYFLLLSPSKSFPLTVTSLLLVVFLFSWPCSSCICSKRLRTARSSACIAERASVIVNTGNVTLDVVVAVAVLSIVGAWINDQSTVDEIQGRGSDGKDGTAPAAPAA
jgi:hypothetical protein